jgi:hypothetical protein
MVTKSNIHCKHKISIRVTRLTCLFKHQRNCPLSVQSFSARQLVDDSDHIPWTENIDTAAKEVNCLYYSLA